MQDVAELSGLSRFTVSKVLNGTAGVSDETKALVLAACEKLSFVPNRHAASLAKGGAQLLGLVVTSIVDAFYGEIIETAERTASDNGFELAFRCSYGSAEQERHIAHNFLGLKASALIVSAASSDENAAFWRALSQKIPVVFIDHVLLESSHVVMTDHYRGARLVTEHLLEVGAPPAYLGSSQPLSNSAIAARRAGYLDAMKDAGKPPRLLDTLESAGENGFDSELASEHGKRWADNERFGYAATARALANGQLAGVRALACATDAIALGAMKALSESGLQPGRDILVAGHDDLPFSAFVEPSLTTVRQPKQDIGEQAVEVAMRLTSAKDFKRVPKVRQVLAPELVVRDSTARRS